MNECIFVVFVLMVGSISLFLGRFFKNKPVVKEFWFISTAFESSCTKGMILLLEHKISL